MFAIWFLEEDSYLSYFIYKTQHEIIQNIQ